MIIMKDLEQFTVTSSHQVKSNDLILVLFGCGQALGYLLLLSLGNLSGAIAAAQAIFFLIFLLYVLSLHHSTSRAKEICEAGKDQRERKPFSSTRAGLAVIVIFALCFRMLLWLSPPTLSDDIYRYLWEGRLVSMGINPFEYAPDAPELEYLRDTEIFPGINHKNFITIYPPLNQFIFWASTELHPTVTMMNLTFMIFDLLTMVVLMLTVQALRIDPGRIIIYAWNPLVIVEFAGSGHLDSAGIFFLMLSFYLFIKNRTFSAIFLLALSFLGKFLALIFLPFILKEKRITGTLLFAAVICGAYLPFSGAGEGLFQSLVIYSQEWVFNPSLFALLSWIVASPPAARWVSAALFMLSIGVLFIRYRKRARDEDKKLIYLTGFAALGSLFLLTPVLHPWYLCWIVPFLVIYPSRAWIFLSGSVFLSYWVLKDYVTSGVWEENNLIVTIEYLPFYALLLFDGIREFRKRS